VSNIFTSWKDRIAQYVDVRIQLMKLSIIERTSSVLSYLIFVFIALFLLLSVLVLIGIGLGEWFSVLFDSRIGGFFAAAGAYILLVVLAVVLRKPLLNAFSGIFIRIMTQDDDDDNRDIPVE
jgi:hypothetical protein